MSHTGFGKLDCLEIIQQYRRVIFLILQKNTTSAIQPVFPLLHLQDKTAQLGIILYYIIIRSSMMHWRADNVGQASTFGLRQSVSMQCYSHYIFKIVTY